MIRSLVTISAKLDAIYIDDCNEWSRLSHQVSSNEMRSY